MTLCKRFCPLYMQQEIKMFWYKFFLNLWSKLLSMISLNYKSEIDFTFHIDIDLDLPKQLQCLVDKTLNCLEKSYLEVVTQISSMKKMFLKIFENLKNACPGVSFSIKLQTGSLHVYKKGPLEQVLSSEFCKIFKNFYIV